MRKVPQHIIVLLVKRILRMPRIRLLQKRGIILIIFSLSFLTYWVINRNWFVKKSWISEKAKPVEPVIDHGHVRLKNDIAARRIRSILEKEIGQNRNISRLKQVGDIENDNNRATRRKNLPLCPQVPPILGRVFVDFDHTHNMTREDVLKQHPDIEFGGTWQPPNCVARHRVAIIIPYRDREQHLVTLLSHLLPILKRQELNFHVFVTEQTGNDTFNKARIMNAAFKEAIKLYDFQCFVFHDVDLIPEDDRNMYSCPVQPRHMSVAIDEMGYRVPYDYLVGGVLSMRTEHFQMVNGYSNLYWGWGAEDDDLAFRILHVGLKITRPPSKVARYKMIKHEKRTPTDWRKRSRLLRTGVRRFNFDGLNSVNYNLISITKTPLFTHVLVDIGKPPSLT